MIISLMDKHAELDKHNLNLKKFGNRIKELRNERNLTQATLAEKIGLSTNFVGMVERGERNTTVDKVFLFAEAFEISLAEFFKTL